MRKTILRIVADNYQKNKVVTHFYDRNNEVPIWGIFQLLTLGEFGYFVSAIDVSIKTKIENSIGINSSYSTNGMLTEKIVYTIKDLRNALSHNEPIYDVRFKTGDIHSNLINSIQKATGVRNINFNNITDYLVLIIYLLKNLGITKTELRGIIRDYSSYMYILRKKISTSDFMKIFPSDTKNKLNDLEKFIAI